jgi:hypothetical protein
VRIALVHLGILADALDPIFVRPKLGRSAHSTHIDVNKVKQKYYLQGIFQNLAAS